MRTLYEVLSKGTLLPVFGRVEFWLCEKLIGLVE